ncbi:phage terminase large subunit family protein [Iodobacter fluviatilis]|uniref:phage terminase large subunit family protein n=1 Tax=Iodobacter fluviatilis TaxID=537 RepID=UPI00404389A8
MGYDPALSGDSAGLIVLAPPLVPGGKFRVLEKRQWKGMDFAAQAQGIKDICSQYNVAYIGIDTTGIGQGVYQLVKQFYPAVRAINYSVEMKARLVMKAQDVIRKGRLEFDAGWTDLAAAFMAIQKTMTASQRHVTYTASRSEELSHADLAWACMHALLNEPLEGANSTNSGFMEIC